MLGMVSSTLVFAFRGVLTFPFPFRVRYGVISQWSRFNLWWLKVCCNLSYVVEGRSNIPADNGIVLCKHQSAFETLVLQQIFPPQVWLLKRELLWIPFFGWGLALLEPIAINRRSARQALRQLLEEGARRLAHGRWVVIFPEGTRVAPGQKGKYAPGGAMLAERTGRPVIPVAHNAGEFWPRRGFIKRPGTIKIVIGEAIESRGRDAAGINAAAERWIEGKMLEISLTQVPRP